MIINRTLICDANFDHHQKRSSPPTTSSKSTELLIQNGRKEYELLLNKRRQPEIYGECWDKAIEKLENNCNDMNELQQSWLSIYFTSCFLQNLDNTQDNDNGHLMHESCKKIIEMNELKFKSMKNKNNNNDNDQRKQSEMINLLKQCTKNMINTNIFNTYTMFFLHTQSICFYLQSERWQKNQENLLQNLITDANYVTNELTNAIGQIENLEKLQHSSLHKQIELNNQLTDAKENLQQFQQQTRLQQNLLKNLLKKFQLLQNFLHEEFSTNSTIIFYLTIMLIIYFLTSSKRTINIRPLLYLLMLASLLIEKNLFQLMNRVNFINYMLPFDSLDQYDQMKIVWIIRKSMITIQISLILWKIVTFKDLNEINNQILCNNQTILYNIHNMLLVNQQRQQQKCIEDYDYDYVSDINNHNDEDDDESDLSDYETDESFILDNDQYDDDYRSENCGSRYSLRPKYCK